MTNIQGSDKKTSNLQGTHPIRVTGRKRRQWTQPSYKHIVHWSPTAPQLEKGVTSYTKVALNQGSLCVLSENTSMEYTFSIPRGNSNSNEHEQLLLFFIGSPSIKTEEDSDHSSQSYNPRSPCESDIITKDTSESEIDSVQGEIEEPSLLANFKIPDVMLITPEDDIHHLTFTSGTMELSATEERLADVIEQDHDITAVKCKRD